MSPRVLAAVAVVWLGACRAQDDAGRNDALQVKPEAEWAHGQPSAKGFDVSKIVPETGGRKEGIVANAKEWAALWERTPPKVDFEKSVVLYIAECTPVHSGCYREFRIERVEGSGGALVATCRTVRNEINFKGGPDFNFHLLQIPKPKERVVFEWKDR